MTDQILPVTTPDAASRSRATIAAASTRVAPPFHSDTERATTAALLLAVAAVNGGVIVWLWLHGGGVSQVHDAAALWTSIGRITGLLAVYTALGQVLLLARIPWLERLIGFDRLTVWHRRNGKLCIYLVLAHVVLITVGYAGSDKISVLSEFSRLLDNYPGMITATIGTGLMVSVVVSSLVIVRRRLPYEAWYFVHLTIYAGIVLAYLHQLPTGNEFAVNTAQADYWIGLYVATLAILLAFRVAVPAWRALRHRLRVAEVVDEGPGVVSVYVTGRHLDGLRVHAGQFMLWRFLSRGRWWQSHPFSLSAVPDGDTLRITVKDVGGYTRALGGLRPGTRVLTEGPFGTFTAQLRHRRRVALIAGGIGITPLRALLEELPAQPGDLTLIYRVVNRDEVVLGEELERIARARGAELHYVVGDHRDAAADSLLRAEHLRELVPDIAQREVFVCGPAAMIEHARDGLRAAGVPARNVHSERFALAA